MIEQLICAAFAFWSISCVLGFCLFMADEKQPHQDIHRVFTSDS